jgi:2-oxoglutarate ferredoxin oxidoreductase subunit beta
MCPVCWGLSPEESVKRIEQEVIPFYPLGCYKEC